jgi:hypothetical protein
MYHFPEPFTFSEMPLSLTGSFAESPAGASADSLFFSIHFTFLFFARIQGIKTTLATSITE